MEKAAKNVKEVEVELKDGSKRTLATITQSDLVNLKLDKDNGFPLKRGTVSDDGETYVERRLFKRTNNIKVVLFDLPIPLTEKSFNSLSFETRHENFVKGYRVARDAEEIGGSSTKSPEKLVDDLEKALVAKGIDPVTARKLVETTRKSMIAAGFGK